MKITNNLFKVGMIIVLISVFIMLAGCSGNSSAENNNDTAIESSVPKNIDRWEYTSFTGFNLEKANSLGQEGWELTTIIGNPAISSSSPFVMIFKRRLP